MTEPLSRILEGSRTDSPSKIFRPELNPVDFLDRAGYMYPDKTAVVHGERRYSFRQQADRSWQLANGLRAAGLRKGDRVAALLPNSDAMLEAHFGVPAAGGILVSINTRLASAEIDYMLDAIEFGPLPKTSIGRVQKFLLREREWAGHKSRIGAT